MRIIGEGGHLTVGGRVAATLGSWRGHGDIMNMTGEARIIDTDEYWFSRGRDDGYQLRLQMGKRILKRDCLTAVINDRGRLEFHTKRRGS